MKTISVYLVALVAAVFFLNLTACDDDSGPDPIIGDWKLTERVCDEYAEMEVEDDLEGTATIYFVYGADCWYADFDFEVERDGKEYIFDMECDGDCGELDFEMECELDGDELECEGDEMWNDFPLDWEKD
jgi:hypothetical protein